jgi:hypothetical protein
VVDAIYSRSFGRRKSWIVPLQLSSVVVMLGCAPWADSHLAAGNVQAITSLFFVLVLLAATQDIAVDGWALTLLSRRHVGYAATCQVGCLLLVGSCKAPYQLPLLWRYWRAPHGQTATSRPATYK